MRRQAVPHADELVTTPWDLVDPLAEDEHSPVPILTHRYPDRALLYVTHNCPVYCRHCTRSRKVGDASTAPSAAMFEAAYDYLRRTPAVRDVLVSGGDPLSLSDRKLAAWRARHVGFVFQFYNLIPVMTAERNVELPLLLTHLSKSERRTHVATALSVVGLSQRNDHYPRQLSGGEQQRVGIARAIVTDPTLLLCDEPTGDLDRKSGDEILALLQALNREHGKTIVMVTHDPHASARATRTVYLNKGQLTNQPEA